MKTEFFILLLSGAVSAALCAAAIPLLKKLNARQYILGYVEEHKSKGGTPTMGGLAFLLAAALCSLLFGLFADKLAAVALTFGLAYMGVGFLDDFLKFRFRRNLGLKAYQKIVFQIVVAVIAGVFCYLNELTVLHIPFTRISFDIGIWIIPLAAFAFVAATNCVNLTDGLDGLAASVSFWYFAALAALIFILSGTQALPLARLCLVLCGVLAGYLLFNTNKASVFMGDTGSLGLGGFVASVSAFSGNLLYIAVIGIMFVCSGISVILQVIYYKRTKKRIFLMAPLHHHFQKKDYSESKIVYAYSLVTAAAGLASLFFVL
ncbi:MAG TPA: phospho-N-acetylmuramoyl-pentapeptide-transferase [Candidatus Borkfalkia excrementigallinarum]|uniref:Phospho-N-acetylmuramoyl-pentapeptide-transferase n=1 Tax=Candidatus Borkfalkia excrementigallinarum TaxID=2838506 RepID=A0A9D1ZW88_9FIRM|nr:phospho-N-acetylmuramoyl-pentapeptide-transferase [Candidatus Borkfalkia excrementigallinarum]